MDIVTYALAKKLVNGVQSGLASATVDNTNCSITFNWTNGTSSTLTFPKPADGVKGDKGDTGVSVQNVEIREISGIRHLIVTLDDSTEIDAGVLPNEQYDDTAIKQDISDLQSDKQDKTDNSLGTTSKTVTGAINEIYGTQLDTVGFSADYKNIILNRKNGLNPYTIPISAIIHNAKLTELNDIDSTDIGNGKTLVYDSTTNKHKYVASSGTDELVKMEASTDAHYLSNLIDKSTIVNDNGTLKVKKLDGQDVTITEINYLKGLTMNVMDLVNMFSNGGVKIINTPVATYADLLTYDKKDLIDGISYLIYVLADETHDGSKTTYLIDTTSTTPTYFGNADNQRNFTTNPIDLANEVTGKLPTNNIDVDALWALLTIDDTYKTLTTTNNVFGTHGAKAMYDELVTAIGAKANSNDLTTHTNDTDIHITSAERTKWNEVDNKVNKTDIVDNLTSTDTNKPLSANQGKILDDKKINKTSIATTIDSTSTDSQVPSAKSVYDNAIKDKKLKTYTSFEQLGITDLSTSSLSDIGVKMGENSSLNVLITSGDMKEIAYNAGIIPTNDVGILYCVRLAGRFKATFSLDTGATGKYISEYMTFTHNISTQSTFVWKKVCATSVEDVAKTNITPSDETIFIGFKNNEGSNYYVQNGICYVTLWSVKISQTGNTIRTGLTLPVPKGTRAGTLMTGNGDATPHAFVYVAPTGELNFDVKDANVMLYGSFSYHVAES